MKRAKKGFTLIEVICVLVIIAIIAAIAVPNISGYIERSKRNNCQSIMTNFVKDLDYKMVSKRYYDINELNTELVDMVKSAANETSESSSSELKEDGTLSFLNEKITSATGICPNGGVYTIEWTINPGTDKSNSADISVRKFECDCPGNGEHISAEIPDRPFTAALIADSEYVNAKTTPEQIYTEKAKEVIKKIISEISNSSQISTAVTNINASLKDGYKVIGASIKAHSTSESDIEWICIDHEIDYGESDESKDKPAHVIFTYSNGVLKQYEMSKTEAADKSKWPPAEGSAGSYLYLEGLGYANQNTGYLIAEDTYTGIVDAWIQRDGNWYVQKNPKANGIDLNGSTEAEKTESRLVSDIYPVGMEIKSSGKSNGSFSDSFQAVITYSDGTKVSQNNIKSVFTDYSKFTNELTETFFLRNGYIIVSDESDVKDNSGKYIDFTGVYSTGNAAWSNYSELKKNESSVIQAFQNGTSNEITFVYQEWYKHIVTDSEGNAEYKYELKTFCKTISKGGTSELPMKSDGSVDTDKIKIEIKPDGNGGFEIVSRGEASFGTDNGDVKVEQEVKIPLLDSSNDSPVQIQGDGVKDIIAIGAGTGNIVYQKPAEGDNPKQEIKIGTITSSFRNTSINYSDKETLNKFDINDLEIKAEYLISVTDSNNNKSSLTDKRTVNHMTSSGDSSGYYFKIKDTGAGYEDDTDIISALNSGICEADIYYKAPGVSDMKIGTIATSEGSISLNYDKESNAKSFDVNRLSVSAVYNLKVTSVNESSKNLSENAQIKFDSVEHIYGTGSSTGWYISDAAGVFEKETELINAVNNGYASADVYYHQSGSADKVIGTIDSELKSIKQDDETTLNALSAIYDNENSVGFGIEYLKVDARYQISVTDITNPGNRRVISAASFVKENISHKESGTNGYVVTTTAAASGADSQTMISYYTGAAGSESSTIAALRKGYDGKLYVVYRDGSVAYDAIDLSISPNIKSLYVAFPDNSETVSESTELYIVGYVGSSTTLYIPDEVQGYWLPLSDNQDASSLVPSGYTSDKYEECTLANGKRALYINDGKKHKINRLGKLKESREAQNESDLRFIISNDAGRDSITISGGIKEIGTFFFKGLTTKNISVDTSEKSLLTTIGSYAFDTFHASGDTDGFTVPASVKNIGYHAFYSFDISGGIMTVNGVSDGNETLGGDIFEQMQSSGLVIGGSVKNIGNEAFAFSQFDKQGSALTLCSGIVTIGDSAFEGVKFNSGSLTIPDSVTTIGNAAFRFSDFGQNDASGGRLSIGKGVTSIGSEAFRECLLFKGNVTVPSSVTKIGSNAFYKFAESSSSPGVLEINGGTLQADGKVIVSSCVYAGAKFTGVKIGGAVDSVADMAFQNVQYEADLIPRRYSLQVTDKAKTTIEKPYDNISGDVIISGKVSEIGDNAFDHCTNISTVDFASNLTEIGDSAFEGCSKLNSPNRTNADGSRVSFTLPSTVKNIGEKAFRDCTGISVPLVLGSSVETIGASAFNNCIRINGSLVIPENVNVIGSRAFYECLGITSLTLTENKENKGARIGIESFRGCTGVKNGLTIPENYTGGIGYLAFMGYGSSASYSEGETPGSLVINAGSYSNGKKLGGFIFTGAKFHNITIGGLVSEIDSNAFHNSASGNIDLESDFANASGSTKIENGQYMNIAHAAATQEEQGGQEGSVQNNKLTADYSKFTGTLTFGSNVKVIGESAFELCTGLTGDLNLSGVEIIKNQAFRSCTGFNGLLSFSDNLSILGDRSFDTCKNFAGSVTIPKSLGKIGKCAFINCSGFNGTLVFQTSEDKTQGVTLIDTQAFDGCTGFNNGLVIPETVKTINNKAFKKFGALSNSPGELRLEGSTSTITNADGTESRIAGKNVFTEGKFKGVYIGGKVTEVEEKAFFNANADGARIDYDSRNSTSIYDAFSGRLMIDDSVTKIGNAAFCNVKFNGPVTLGSNITYIGANAFDHCTDVRYGDFEGLTIGSKVTYIGDNAFSYFSYFASDGKAGYLNIYGYSEKSGSDYYIGYKDPGSKTLFNHAKFKNVTIGRADSKITKIGYRFMKTESQYDYDYSGITGKLEIYSGVTEIMDEAFMKSGFSGELKLSSGLVTIGDHAFAECRGFTGALVIPDTVQTISGNAFFVCEGFNRQLNIGSSVKTIGDAAFSGCTGFYTAEGEYTKSLEIPASVETLETNAFYKFASHTVSYSETLDSNGNPIPGKTVTSPSLTINGGNKNGTAVKIGDHRFPFAKFNNVTIGGSITEIDEKCFSNQSKDGAVYYADNGDAGSGKDSMYNGFGGTLTIGGNITSVGKFAFDKCEYFTGLDINNGHLSSIYEGAFARCKRVKGGLYIPATVNYIERCAFKEFAEFVSDTDQGELKIYGTSDNAGNLGNHNLDSDGAPIFPAAKFKNVVIGGNVRKIAHDQFNNQSYYDFGSDLTYEENGEVVTSPFRGDSNTYKFDLFTGNLTIEEGVTDIGNTAFACTKFDNVSIPASVTNIGERAFMYVGSGNGNLTVLGTSNNDDTKTLGDGRNPIFLGAKFRDVTIGGSVKNIGKDFMHNQKDYAKYTCEEEEETKDADGNTVTTKKKYSYNYDYSGFTGKLTLGNSVVSIGESAFESCNFHGRLILGEKLKDVSICTGDPHMTTIGAYAFKNCIYMSDELVIPSTMKSIGLNAFFCFASQTDNPGKLTMWAGTKIDGNVGSANVVEAEVFSGAQFKGVKIDGCVHIINEGAFNKKSERISGVIVNNNLTGSLELGAGVENIGKEAFLNCDFDGELVIGGGKTVNYNDGKSYPNITIGQSAFKGCKKFYSEYTLKEGETQGELYIPEKVVSIGLEAFREFASAAGNEPKLTIKGGSADNGATLTNAGGNIFADSHFKNVSIGGKITKIDTEALKTDYNAYDNLTGSLTIENTVTYIGERAFKGCDGFTGEVIIPSSVTTIGKSAFCKFGNNVSMTILGGSTGSVLGNGTDPIFGSASIKNLTIGGNVTKIGNNLFNNYSNRKMQAINDDGTVKKDADGNVVMILNPDYYYDNITGNLIIGESVTEIGTNAFWDCTGIDGFIEFNSALVANNTSNTGLKTIGYNGISGCINAYTSSDIPAANRKLVIPATVTSIGQYAFKALGKNLGDTANSKFPSLELYGTSGTTTENSKSYKSVGEVSSVFTLCRFKNVTIGGNVEYVCDDFFNNWKHSGIYTKDANAQDDSNNFNYSFIFGDLKIEDNTVKYIGDSAFAHNTYDNVYIGKGISQIKRCAFKYAGTGNGKLTIYSGTVNKTTLGDSARNNPVFIMAQFNGLTIGGDVTTISESFMKNDDHQFMDKTNMPLYCRYDDIMGDITIEGSVTTIGNYAFYQIENESVASGRVAGKTVTRGRLILSEGLQSIGASAFEGTRFFGSLDSSVERKLTIPSTVTSIGSNAFKDFCSNFNNKPSLVIKCSTRVSSDTYKSNTALGLGLIGGSTLKNPRVLSGCSSIFTGSAFNNVTIDSEVIIESEAFDGLKWTGSLVLSDKVIGVWESAFKGNSFSSVEHSENLLFCKKSIGKTLNDWTSSNDNDILN